MSREAIRRAGLIVGLLLTSAHCVNPDANHNRVATGVSHNCLARGPVANRGTQPDVASQKNDRAPGVREGEAFDRKTAMRGYEALTRQGAAAAADKMEAQADVALAPECDSATGSRASDPGLEQLRRQLVQEMQRVRGEHADQRRRLELEGADSKTGAAQ